MAPYPLTAKQKQAYRFIAGYIEAKGEAPTVQHIVDCVGGNAKSKAHHMISRMIERGWIERLPNRARAIKPLVPVAIPRDPQGNPLYFVAPHVRRVAQAAIDKRTAALVRMAGEA